MDFLLQENGDLILLEDGTGALLLEDPIPPPPTSDSTWKVGVINVPGSTGSASVTGLGGTPAAVFFFGTNWTTEDTAVTTSGTGVFRGMAAPQYDDPGTILQNAASVQPTGVGFNVDNYAVNMLDTGTGILYRASLTSLDADGFTLNWVTVNSSYKVVYVALMDVVEVGAGVTSGGVFSDNLGWKAGAMLMHGAYGTLSQQDFGYTRQFFGGAAYPGTTGGGSWYGAGLTAFSFPPSAFQQYLIGIFNNDPDVVVAQDGSFIGPFLSPQNIVSVPTGGSLEDFYFNTNDTGNSAMFVAWDDDASQTGRLAPAQDQGDTMTVSGLPFTPGLVIGYTISDEPAGLGSSNPFGARGAVGFSVATETFQWSALVDGVNTRGSFQSFQRGVTDTVIGTGVHAGTVTLTADGFVVTTEEDAVDTHDWVWHAFGHPDRIVKWIPHIYRRVLG